MKERIPGPGPWEVDPTNGANAPVVSKHTLGPWKLVPASKFGLSRVTEERLDDLVIMPAQMSDTEAVALALIYRDTDSDLANAHLIAAAPAMMEAIEKLVAEWERQKGLFPDLSKDGWMDLAIAEAKTVIAKARGEL